MVDINQNTACNILLSVRLLCSFCRLVIGALCPLAPNLIWVTSSILLASESQPLTFSFYLLPCSLTLFPFYSPSPTKGTTLIHSLFLLYLACSLCCNSSRWRWTILIHRLQPIFVTVATMLLQFGTHAYQIQLLFNLAHACAKSYFSPIWTAAC